MIVTMELPLNDVVRSPRASIDVLATAERAVIERVLESVSGNITHAAERLGIHRSSLQRKMRRYGLR